MSIQLTPFAARFASVATVVLLALPAWSANLVEVRVGRHPEFTRVVFQLDLAGGYDLSRHGDLLVVKLAAQARPQALRPSSPVVESLEVETAVSGSVARIRLRHPDLRVREMILANPPRIVIDVMVDANLTGAAPPRLPADEASLEIPEAREAAETTPVERSEPEPRSTVVHATVRDEAAPADEVVRGTQLFSGFQIDNEAQYFSYLGLRKDLPWESFGLKASVQLFVAGQEYEYESGNRDIDADVQFLIPSLGVTKALGDGAWSVSGAVGPKLQWKKEDGFLNDSGRDFEVGVFAQAETTYWRETHSLQGIVSYASLDDFFFGRVRGKLLAYSPETGCCSLFGGLDVAGMGNQDFSAVQTGPLLEVPIGRTFLLLRGGYQYDSNFGSGTYGALEIYAPF